MNYDDEPIDCGEYIEWYNGDDDLITYWKRDKSKEFCRKGKLYKIEHADGVVTIWDLYEKRKRIYPDGSFDIIYRNGAYVEYYDPNGNREDGFDRHDRWEEHHPEWLKY